MKYLKSLSLVLLIAFTLTGCVSLAPETTVDKGQVDEIVESITIDKDEKYDDAIISEKIILEVIDYYDVKKDDYLLTRYNTLYGVRPYHSVYVVNLTGSPHIYQAILELKGYTDEENDERAVFDYLEYKGNENGELFILAFMEPIEREEFDKIAFKAVLNSSNGGEITHNVPIKPGVSMPEPIGPGSVYKLSEGNYVALTNKVAVEESSEMSNGMLYRFIPELIAFGDSVNVSKNDFRITLSVNGKETEVPMEKVFLNPDKSIGSSMITKTEMFKLDTLLEISYSDISNKDVAFKLYIGDNEAAVIPIKD